MFQTISKIDHLCVFFVCLTLEAQTINRRSCGSLLPWLPWWCLTAELAEREGSEVEAETNEDCTR